MFLLKADDSFLDLEFLIPALPLEERLATLVLQDLGMLNVFSTLIIASKGRVKESCVD